MASVYMPDVKVEIAFNAGFTTPAVDRVWTDVSAYVELEEGITIGGGRSDARGTIDANSLSLSLDNSDGRFTPGLASSPYSPNVKIGRPIRVTAKPAGSAVTTTRFLGYVDSWPLEWSEGVTQYAVARITAASRLARLGRTGTLLSAAEVETLPLGPVHYWTMGDPKDSTQAADSIGTSTALPMSMRGGGSTSVVFGDGIGIASDGLTAATFVTGGKYLRAVGAVTASADFTVGAFYATTDTTFGVIIGCGEFYAGVLLNGKLRLGSTTSAADDPGTAVNDGEVHHVALRYTAATKTCELLRDGVVVATNTDAAAPANGTVYVGNNIVSTIIHSSLDTLAGTVCHVSAFDYKVADADLVRVAGAGSGFSGETAAARAERYARWGGALTADTSVDVAATTPMRAIDSTGQTVVGLLRKVEATEGGVLFDSRDGILTYTSRHARFNRPADVTLSVESLEAGATPRLDDSELVNRATAVVTDDLSVVATNDESREAYGEYDLPFEILTTSLPEAEGRCWWTVTGFGEPQIRVPNLTADVLPLELATQEALAAVDIGDRIATTGSWPAQIGTILDAGFFVEGYAERFGPESWEITFNVSPGSAADVFELDDATLGLLDGPYPLAY